MNTLFFSAPQLQSAQVQAVLQHLGLNHAHVHLQHNTAHITLPQGIPHDEASFRQQLRQASQHAQCDVALLPPNFQAQQFKLLAMDMDSTLITIECIDEIADFAGKKKEVSEITEAAMRGEISNFSDSLTRRVALLQGVPANCLEAVYTERLRLSPGAPELIAFAKHSGWKTLLVSGGFTFFTDKMKELLGLDYTHANTLEIVDGKLTGNVLGPIVDAQAKRETVQTTCHTIGCSPQQALVIGDGANDLQMMAISGASVAFMAKPTVQEQTRFCINHGGLDTLVNWFN